MKRVKLFEQFLADINPAEETQEVTETPETLKLDESMMSEIDLIGKDAPSKDAFKEQVIDFIKKHAKGDTKAADNDAFIEELASTYFNEDGTKKDIEA